MTLNFIIKIKWNKIKGASWTLFIAAIKFWFSFTFILVSSNIISISIMFSFHQLSFDLKFFISIWFDWSCSFFSYMVALSSCDISSIHQKFSYIDLYSSHAWKLSCYCWFTISMIGYLLILLQNYDSIDFVIFYCIYWMIR